MSEWIAEDDERVCKRLDKIIELLERLLPAVTQEDTSHK